MFIVILIFRDEQTEHRDTLHLDHVIHRLWDHDYKQSGTALIAQPHVLGTVLVTV